MVRFRPGLSSAARQRLLERYDGVEIGASSELGLHVIAVAPDRAATTLKRLESNPAVRAATPDEVRQIAGGSSGSALSGQWALQKIGWASAHSSVRERRQVKVAVLDTGVDAAALTGRLAPGYSAFGSSPTTDLNGHGTWMASLAATVDPGAEILPVQVLDAKGLGRDSDIIKGLLWAVDHHANVVLMSFAGTGYSPALQSAIDYAWAKGTVVVAATGNSGSSTPSYPAGDAKVVGVSATDQADHLWAGSSYGADTFLAAPGVGVTTSAVGGAIKVVTGTSASAAIVAGSASLLLAANLKLSNGSVVGRLAASAQPAGTRAETGNGRLDLGRALTLKHARAIVPAGVISRTSGGPFAGPYLAASASTAPTVVGSAVCANNGSVCSASSSTLVVPVSAVGLNSTLFIIAGWNSSSTTSFSATDNLATHNTYTQDAHINNATSPTKTVSLLRSEITQPLGNNTITVTFPASSTVLKSATVFYVNGTNTTSPLDSTAGTGTGNSTSASAATGSTTNANDLVVGAAATATVGAGNNSCTALTAAGVAAKVQEEPVYKTTASTGALTCGAAVTSGTWAAVVGGYKVDKTAPSAAVIQSGTFTPLSWGGQVTGTATDNSGGSGIDVTSYTTQLSIHDDTANAYWDGSALAWGSAGGSELYFSPTGSSGAVVAGSAVSWNYSFDKANLITTHIYTVHATTTDYAGNLSPVATTTFSYVATATNPWVVASGTQAASTANISITTTDVIPQNSTLFITAAQATTTGTGTWSVSDPNGANDSWSTDVDNNGGTERIALLRTFVSSDIASGSTITVTVPVTASTAKAWTAFYVKGLLSTNPLDKSSKGGATSTAWSTGSTAATAQASELVIAAGVNGGSATYGSQSCTAIGSEQGAANNVGEQAFFRPVTVAAAQSCAATLSVSKAWGAAIGTYKVDTTNPSAAVTFPLANFYNSTGWTGSITGTATDESAGSGVDTGQTLLSIHDDTGGSSWHEYNSGGLGPNGPGSCNIAPGCWLSGSTNWALTLTTGPSVVSPGSASSWSYTFDRTRLTDGHTYTVFTKTADYASNRSLIASKTFTYDTTAPVYSSAVTNVLGTKITLTYTEATSGLNTTMTPAASAFAVQVNGVSRSVSTVTVIDGTHVDLTLSSRVFGGDTVTVQYTQPGSNKLQDNAGNLAASNGSAQSVTNTAPASLSQSVVSPSPASIPADGSSTSTITIQLKTSAGASLSASGGAVTVSTTDGTFPSSCAASCPTTDNGNGTYTATLTSSTTGHAVTVSAELDGSSLSNNTTVTFTGGVPAKLAISSHSNSATAGSSFTVTVQAQSAGGSQANVTQDTGISLAISTHDGGGSAGTLTNTTGTITNGSSSVTLTTVQYTKAEHITITASTTSGMTLSTSSASTSITINPGAVSALNLSAASTTPTAGVTDNLTAKAVDTYGNTVNGGPDGGSNNYTGDKTLTFTGPASIGGNIPTVTSKTGVATNIGTGETVAFTNGVADQSTQVNQLNMVLYKTETALVVVSDGTVTNAGLSFTVGPATAAKLAISGASSQAAGAAQPLTLTAKDTYGNLATGYTGDKSVTFSGAANSPSGANPTVTNKTGSAVAFGTGEAITFASGVADQSVQTSQLSMVLKKVETASVHVTDGSISSNPDLSVTVSAASASALAISGSASQTAGAAQSLTITAKDTYGNVAVGYSGDKGLTFSGAANAPSGANPTVTSKTGGAVAFATSETITFANGVADQSVQASQLSAALKKVESASVHVTDGVISSSPDLSVVVSAAPASMFVISGAGSQTAGVAQALSVTTKDVYGNVAAGYSGDKTLTFSGAASSPSGGNPTVTSKTGVAPSFGTGETITFAGGVANQSVQASQLSMVLKKVESASVHVTDGTIASSPDLPVTVAAASASSFTIAGSATQTAGAAQSLSLTAKDAYGNLATGYTGDKSVTFSGAANSPSGASPTVASKTGTAVAFGTSETVTFASGVADQSVQTSQLSLVLKKAETAAIHATDGTITSNPDLPVSVSPASASNLAINGSGSQTAGAAQSLTVTAKDVYANIATGYTGDKTLTFGGAANAPAGTHPTVTDKNGAAVNFGTATTVTFSNGAASVSGSSNGVMKLYRAEAASVAVSDGSISTGSSLSVTVNPGSAASLSLIASTTSPGAGASDNLTLTALDSFGNTSTGYSGDKSLTFGGAANASNGTHPTVTDKTGVAVNFGTATTITFSSGLASVSGSSNGVMILYKAEPESVTVGDGSISNSGLPVTVSPASATRLVVTGAGSQQAGGSQTVTVRATDPYGNTDTTYSGNKTAIQFSGANNSSSPITHPTASDNASVQRNFGSTETLTFASGVANSVVYLYAAETAQLAVTDGTIAASSGNDRLGVNVTNSGLATFNVLLQSTQTDGIAFTGANTATAQDAYGNTVTGFDAAATPVTFTASSPFTGAISGLHASNILNQSADFVNGVADLSALGIKYTGSAATGTIRATSSTGKTGDSGAVTVQVGSATKLVITTQPGGVITGGSAFPVQPLIKVEDVGNNVVTSDNTTQATLTIAANPAGGSLAGTTTRTAAAGVATFSGLSIDKSGTGYTLATANTASLANDTSVVFNVVDLTPPVSIVQFPSDTNTYNTGSWNSGSGACTGAPSASICGAVSDSGGSGVQKVQISVRDGIGNYYAGSTTCSTGSGSFSSGSETYLDASGVLNWSCALPTLALTDGHSYTLHVRATDNAGNVESFQAFSFNYTSAPSVAAVSATNANGTYVANQVVHLQVTFSDPVFVVGKPRLLLETGSIDESVNYSSGSGTSTLTFDYTVEPGDTSSDLDTHDPGALTLHGGSIASGGGRAAILTLVVGASSSGSLANAKNIVVAG